MIAVSTLVGIVTRNREEVLPKAIASALTLTKINCQVAVLDDGSVDSTHLLASRFPQVKWTGWKINQGLIQARNHLMESGVQDYFVSLDDDAWFVQGDEVSIGVDFLERNPMVGAVAFDILSPDRPNPSPRTEPSPTAMFIGCGHILRLSAVKLVGLYELSPGSYGGEEKDLCLRLMDAGYKIFKLPGVHVWHDKTPISREIPNQHRSGVCNDMAMTLRRTPASLLLVAIMAKLYRHLKFSVQNGLLRPCLQGFGLFFRSIPAIWRSRKPVRAETLRAYIRLSSK